MLLPDQETECCFRYPYFFSSQTDASERFQMHFIPSGNDADGYAFIGLDTTLVIPQHADRLMAAVECFDRDFFHISDSFNTILRVPVHLATSH